MLRGIRRLRLITLLLLMLVPAPTRGADAPTDATERLFQYGYFNEPYPLDPGPHLFVDWRYIYPGKVQYSLPGGGEVGHSSPEVQRDDIPNVRSMPTQVPFGIRLVAQRAESIGPVLKIDKPWEYLVAYVNVIKVGDEYRLYYEALPTRNSDVPGSICLATSRDGLEWTKPELGVTEFQSSKANNIVFSSENSRYGLHGHQVFVDPLAPSEERFKLIYMGSKAKDRDLTLVSRLKQERPHSVHPNAESRHLVIMAAVSPDGIHWKERAEPLMSHMNDSGPVVYYDQKLKKYVGYFREIVMGRRAIARSETKDFWNWPRPQLVLWPNPMDEPSDDYYTNSHTLYPGTQSIHLMFPVIFKRKIDGAAMRLASSLEGSNWQWVPGDDILVNGPIDSWNAGWFVGGSGMLEIPNDRVAIPYTASPLPHKFPRVIPIGQVGLAAWPKERLSALVADQDGEFVTLSFTSPGGELYLNFDTPRTGSVAVEVEGVPGRMFEDCDPLYGDELKKKVTWKGDSSLGIKPGERFQLKFRMHSAKLFSFELR